MASRQSGSDVCIANIGPRERKFRLVSGIVLLSVGVSILGALALFGAGPLWGLALFIPFWGGATGFFQAREKT